MVCRQIPGEPPQALEHEIVDAPMRNAEMLADDDGRSAGKQACRAVAQPGDSAFDGADLGLDAARGDRVVGAARPGAIFSFSQWQRRRIPRQRAERKASRAWEATPA